MPGAVEAAGALVAWGVDLVVVGGTALWLHGDRSDPLNDLDVVPAPDPDNLDRLVASGVEMVTDPRRWPTRRSLQSLGLVSVRSVYGPIDLLCERGREEFDRLRASASILPADGIATPVAAIADVRRLKARFKEEEPGGRS